MDALPAHRIRAIHIAGGTEVEATSGERRLLDDHRHAVPDSVYALLERVGERVPHAIDVILERDGAFPPIDVLLGELDRARAALAAGRARRAAGVEDAAPGPEQRTPAPVRLLDAGARGGTRASRRCSPGSTSTARRASASWRIRTASRGDAGLDDEACTAMRRLDRPGLELAPRSFASKRLARER